jgi:hypothetical protein
MKEGFNRNPATSHKHIKKKSHSHQRARDARLHKDQNAAAEHPQSNLGDLAFALA